MFTAKSFTEVERQNRENDISLRQAALAGGLSIILMAAPAVFANFLVIEGVVVPGDAAATVANVQANEMQFRLGIISILVVIILDIIAAWGLYVFYKPANKSLSLLAGWFRLAYAAFFGAAMFNLLNALRLLSFMQSDLTNLQDLSNQLLLSLNAFSDQWGLGLSIFGLHLLLLGYVALKSSYTPRILGILVIIAGLGYPIDSLAGLMIPGAGISISMLTFFGEAFLAVWLVVKGLRSKSWAQPALESLS